MYSAIPLCFVNFPFHYLLRACKIRNWNELIFCNFVLGSRRRTGNYDNLLWSSLLIGPKGTMKFGTVNKNFHTKEYHTVMMRMRTRHLQQKWNVNHTNVCTQTDQVSDWFKITTKYCSYIVCWMIQNQSVLVGKDWFLDKTIKLGLA